MSRICTFELHRCRGGRWTIDSIFDDRDLALVEGRNMLRRRYAQGVRVIEERMDEESGETTTRIIFQGRKDEPSQGLPSHLQQRIDALRRPAPAPPPKPNSVTSTAMVILAVGGFGLATIFGLMIVLG